MILKGSDYTTFLSKKQIQRVLKNSRQSVDFLFEYAFLDAKILKFSPLAGKILFHRGLLRRAKLQCAKMRAANTRRALSRR